MRPAMNDVLRMDPPFPPKLGSEGVVIIPAAPGHYVVYIHDVDEGEPFSASAGEAVIAWQLYTDLHDYDIVTPITSEGPTDDHHALLQPDGRVMRGGRMYFASMAEFIDQGGSW